MNNQQNSEEKNTQAAHQSGGKRTGAESGAGQGQDNKKGSTSGSGAGQTSSGNKPNAGQGKKQ